MQRSGRSEHSPSSGGHFPMGGGRQNHVEAVKAHESVRHVKHTLDTFDQHHFERRQSTGKAIAMKSGTRNERELGGLRACPQKNFLRPHLERQLAPFCRVGCNLFSSLSFMPRKES